jgi:hypothetical protein
MHDGVPCLIWTRENWNVTQEKSQNEEECLLLCSTLSQKLINVFRMGCFYVIFGENPFVPQTSISLKEILVLTKVYNTWHISFSITFYLKFLATVPQFRYISNPYHTYHSSTQFSLYYSSFGQCFVGWFSY